LDKIAIVGTGLIGASLGMAIRQSMPKAATVVGTDRDRGNSADAQKMGALDKVENSLRSAVEGADIVVVATPVTAIRDVFQAISPYLSEGCLVTDTGSSKAEVMRWAEETLPRHVNFVGGHPMAGKETAGPKNAEANLFRNKTYCVIPAPRARADAVNTWVKIIEGIGARHYFIDAGEHDSFVAAASHLPALLSVALVRTTSRSPSWADIAKVASTGYRDITRLASGDPIMHRDICATNSDLIVSWIDAFMYELYDMRLRVIKAGEGDASEIEDTFSDALYRRQQWITGSVTPGANLLDAREPLPTFGESMGQLLLGSRLMEHQKRLMEGWGRDKREGQDDDKKPDQKS
jgi:prephenate dehydrogenase